MPLQYGPLFITGTLDDICFYQMHGKYYARMKSSLTRKRVLKDPKFQLTRVYASLLGEASTIASRVYRLVTGERKKHALYRELTGKAIYLLREGKDKEAVFQLLCEQYLKSALIMQAGLPVSHKKEIVKDDKRCHIAGVRLTVPRLKKKYMDQGVGLQTSRRKKRYFLTLHHGVKQHSLGP